MDYFGRGFQLSLEIKKKQNSGKILEQGPVAQKLPLMVTLPSMVTTMEILILIGCWALLPW